MSAPSTSLSAEDHLRDALRPYFWRACKLMAELSETSMPPTPDLTLEGVSTLKLACQRAWESGADYKLEYARDLFQAIHHALELIEGSCDQDAPRSASVALLRAGDRLGRADELAIMATRNFSGASELDQILQTSRAHARVGAGPRKRVPPWRTAVVPHLKACIIQYGSRVNKGILTRAARAWAAEQSRNGKNVGLPSTDKAIREGINWLIDKGDTPHASRRGNHSLINSDGLQPMVNP